MRANYRPASPTTTGDRVITPTAGRPPTWAWASDVVSNSTTEERPLFCVCCGASNTACPEQTLRAGGACYPTGFRLASELQLDMHCPYVLQMLGIGWRNMPQSKQQQ